MNDKDAMSKLADELVERLGLKGNMCGVHVNGVFPGSIAEKAGIQRGDLLLSCNSIPLMSLKDYVDVMQDRPQVQVFDVLRNNKLIQITIECNDD